MRWQRVVVALGLALGVTTPTRAHAFDWAGKVEVDAADLDSDDPKKRLDAVAQLGADDPALAAPYLMKVIDKDADASVREAAARALGAGGSEAAVPSMIQWLNNPDKKEAATAAEVLGDIGGDAATSALIRSLGDSDAGVRVNAVRALGKIGLRGNPNVVIALIPRLEDDKPEVKRETIDQLEQLGDRRAVIPLVARFGDTQQEIRNRAIRAVGRLGDTSAVPALIRLLDDSNEDVRSAAAGALGQLGATEAIDALTEQLNSGSDLFREKVAIALAQIAASPTSGKAGEDAMRILVANLASPQQRARTVSALKLAGRAAVPALVAHLSGRLAGDPTTAVQLLDDAADARATAALTAELERGRVATPLVLKALGATHDPAALVPLLGALSNKDAAIRLAAMEALEPLLGDDARAGDVLIEHLGDDDLEVRVLAAQYLGELADAAAAPKLIALTQAGNPERLRLAAIDALGEIGVKGKIAGGAAALVAVLRDSPTPLHRAAATALSYLQDPDAIEPLISLARADRSPTRDEVVRALGATLRGKDASSSLGTARRVLRDLADDANPRVADAAICGLAAANNLDDAPFLREVTEQGASDRRRSAAWALGELHDTGGLAVLATAMGSTDDRLAGDAAWAVGEIVAASPADAKLPALADTWLHLARHGAWASSIDGTAALARALWAVPREARGAIVAGTRRSDLAALAFHRSRLVRIDAAVAFGALAAAGDDDAIKSLVALARDGSPHVRVAAVHQLVQLASKDDRVAGAIHAAQVDSDASVRDAAKAAPPAQPAAALLPRTEWATFYVVDPSADDAAVRQEAYFIQGADGLVWATYSDARGDITSEHVPHGDSTILAASRESEY
jgi:HEAT repeat protein|nr:HEAT repeat domain-containing protein [Kofleriaceae bacterium]